MRNLQAFLDKFLENQMEQISIVAFAWSLDDMLSVYTWNTLKKDDELSRTFSREKTVLCTDRKISDMKQL